MLILFIAMAAATAYYLRPSERHQVANTGSSADIHDISAQPAAINEAAVQGDPASQPVLTGAKLSIENAGGDDIIKVIPSVKGQRNAITFRYEWTKNGQPAGNDDKVVGLKRGDRLSVKVTPFDGKVDGEPGVFVSEVMNTTPRISEIKQISLDDSDLIYKVLASDPDGDTLSYSLVDAPKGMTVDQNGNIRWHFEKEDYGKALPVKVKVSDGHGGETVGQINSQPGAK